MLVNHKPRFAHGASGAVRPPERRLVFDPRSGHFRPHVRVERYVRTIPFDWMRRANRLPGNAAAVAVSLWFLAGVKKAMTFRLTAEAVDLAGCGRKSLYRALNALEQAGLINVLRRPGARPIITVNTTLPVARPIKITAENGENSAPEIC